MKRRMMDADRMQAICLLGFCKEKSLRLGKLLRPILKRKKGYIIVEIQAKEIC
jgi:hypothetical protein